VSQELKLRGAGGGAIHMRVFRSGNCAVWMLADVMIIHVVVGPTTGQRRLRPWGLIAAVAFEGTVITSVSN
jgi:hypothetical protein